VPLFLLFLKSACPCSFHRPGESVTRMKQTEVKISD
ncbi:MAG: hypothetical protein ACI9CO_002102, partial [Candidatus Azotimanducaceae bacterium]